MDMNCADGTEFIVVYYEENSNLRCYCTREEMYGFVKKTINKNFTQNNYEAKVFLRNETKSFCFSNA